MELFLILFCMRQKEGQGRACDMSSLDKLYMDDWLNTPPGQRDYWQRELGQRFMWLNFGHCLKGGGWLWSWPKWKGAQSRRGGRGHGRFRQCPKLCCIHLSANTLNTLPWTKPQTARVKLRLSDYWQRFGCCGCMAQCRYFCRLACRLESTSGARITWI